MGPLVPTIISDEFDLILALFLGFGFGFILEQAGFSNSKRLVGLFYGKNFVVLKVFFTAGITAMVCVLAAGHFGLLDLNLIYVNPTFLPSAIIGGLIMGAGFIVGGFCPGTSVCASAIGKLDGITFVMGSLLGIYFFAELYPLVADMYMAGAKGPVTVYEILGISPVTFAILLSAIAIGMFVLVTYIESRVNKTSFKIRKKRVLQMGMVAFIPFLIIATTAFMPDRSARIEAYMNDPARLEASNKKAMDADGLAFEIINKYYEWNIIDVRSPEEYKAWHLPLSINIPLDSMQNREWESYFKQKYKKNVFTSNVLQECRKAYVLSQVIGDMDSYILANTVEEFRGMFFSPEQPAKDATKDEVNLYHFRVQSARKIEDLATSLARFHTKPQKKKIRKVQGGCS